MFDAPLLARCTSRPQPTDVRPCVISCISRCLLWNVQDSVDLGLLPPAPAPSSPLSLRRTPQPICHPLCGQECIEVTANTVTENTMTSLCCSLLLLLPGRTGCSAGSCAGAGSAGSPGPARRVAGAPCSAAPAARCKVKATVAHHVIAPNILSAKAAQAQGNPMWWHL